MKNWPKNVINYKCVYIVYIFKLQYLLCKTNTFGWCWVKLNQRSTLSVRYAYSHWLSERSQIIVSSDAKVNHFFLSAIVRRLKRLLIARTPTVCQISLIWKDTKEDKLRKTLESEFPAITLLLHKVSFPRELKKEATRSCRGKDRV